MTQQRFTNRKKRELAIEVINFLREHPTFNITSYENEFGYTRGSLRHFVNNYKAGKYDNLTDVQLDYHRICTKKRKNNSTEDTTIYIENKIEDPIVESSLTKTPFNVYMQLDRIEKMVKKLYEDLS